MHQVSLVKLAALDGLHRTLHMAMIMAGIVSHLSS